MSLSGIGACIETLAREAFLQVLELYDRVSLACDGIGVEVGKQVAIVAALRGQGSGSALA
jgi:hypothetical protein